MSSKWTLYSSQLTTRELDPARFALYLAGTSYNDEVLSPDQAVCVSRRSPSQCLPFLHHNNGLYSGTFAITLLAAKEAELLPDDDPVSLLRCAAILELTMDCLRSFNSPEIAQALKAVEGHLARRSANESLDIGDICACVLHDAIVARHDGLSEQQVKQTFPHVQKATLRVEGLKKLRRSISRGPPRLLLPWFEVCVAALR